MGAVGAGSGRGWARAALLAGRGRRLVSSTGGTEGVPLTVGARDAPQRHAGMSALSAASATLVQVPH